MHLFFSLDPDKNEKSFIHPDKVKTLTIDNTKFIQLIFKLLRELNIIHSLHITRDGEKMKSLKKLPLIFLLFFNFIQLWAVENEKLDQFKKIILALYNSQMSIYKRILTQENYQDSKLLSEASEKNSKKLMDTISKMDFLEFKESFEAAWTNKNEEIRNSNFWKLELYLNNWYDDRVVVFLNACEEKDSEFTQIKLKTLMIDEFYPCSQFLDQKSKEQYNPYFWLLDEMIQFLLIEKSTKKSLHISDCFNLLLRSSESVPLANNKLVQEIYGIIWINEVILEKTKLERLKQIFTQSENSWIETGSKLLKDLKEGVDQEWNFLIPEQKTELKKQLENVKAWKNFKKEYLCKSNGDHIIKTVRQEIFDLIEFSIKPTEKVLNENGFRSDLIEKIIEIYNELYHPLYYL